MLLALALFGIFKTVTAKEVQLTDFTAGSTIKQAFSNAIATISDGDTLLIGIGTYEMDELIFIDKKITVKGINSGNRPLFKKVASSATNNKYLFIVGTNAVKFENLILDGDNIITGALINTNDKEDVQVDNCLLKNTGYSTVVTGSYSGASGIASETLYNGSYKPGTPTSGLIVKNCEFLEIGNVCVYVINRNTIVAGREINIIKPLTVENCTFTNYNRGIIADCGNDYEIPGCKSSKLRYVTNLNGSTYKNNKFGQADLWHIGKVQAKNVNIIGNEMAGPKDTEEHKSDPITCIHLEEMSDSILIQNNTFINSIGRGKMIDIQARKKWETCDTPYAANDINRYVPEWVPKGVKIIGNSFSGNASICLDGFDINGIVITRNDFTGFTGKWMVNYVKGAVGCCNIILPNTGDDKNIGLDISKVNIIWADGCADTDPYKIPLDNVSFNIKQKNIELYPNPANDFITVNTQKDTVIYIIDTSGRILITQNVANSSERIDVSKLSCGIYFVKTGDKASKLIIQ